MSAERKPVDVYGALDAWVNEVPIGIDEAHRRLAVRNAIGELVEANAEALFEIVTALADYQFSAEKANSLNAARRRLEASIAAVREGAK